MQGGGGGGDAAEAVARALQGGHHAQYIGTARGTAASRR